MRTTVRIDDDLYRRVKARAAHEGRTVAAVLEDAVRIGMSPTTTADSGPYIVRTHGGGGVKAGVDLTSNASVAELLDTEESLETLR